MKILPKKINIPILKALPVFYLCVLALSFLMTLVFLYRNFYLTIAQVETVAELERTVSRERLNRKVWDAVIDARLKKLTIEDSEQATSTPSTLIRDPFQPL